MAKKLRAPRSGGQPAAKGLEALASIPAEELFGAPTDAEIEAAAEEFEDGAEAATQATSEQERLDAEAMTDSEIEASPEYRPVTIAEVLASGPAAFDVTTAFAPGGPLGDLPDATAGLDLGDGPVEADPDDPEVTPPPVVKIVTAAQMRADILAAARPGDITGPPAAPRGINPNPLAKRDGSLIPASALAAMGMAPAPATPNGVVKAPSVAAAVAASMNAKLTGTKAGGAAAKAKPKGGGGPLSTPEYKFFRSLEDKQLLAKDSKRRSLKGAFLVSQLPGLPAMCAAGTFGKIGTAFTKFCWAVTAGGTAIVVDKVYDQYVDEVMAEMAAIAATRLESEEVAEEAPEVPANVTEGAVDHGEEEIDEMIAEDLDSVEEEEDEEAAG